MKLKQHHPKRSRAAAKRQKVTWFRRLVHKFTGVWVFPYKEERKIPSLTAQIVINHLTRNERKMMRQNLGVSSPTVAQVIKAVWPISQYAGMETFHRRTDGRYQT